MEPCGIPAETQLRSERRGAPALALGCTSTCEERTLATQDARSADPFSLKISVYDPPRDRRAKLAGLHPAMRASPEVRRPSNDIHTRSSVHPGLPHPAPSALALQARWLWTSTVYISSCVAPHISGGRRSWDSRSTIFEITPAEARKLPGNASDNTRHLRMCPVPFTRGRNSTSLP